MEAKTVKAETLPAQEPAAISGQEAALQKRKRRRRRALRSFLFRLLALVLVVYVLFFHIVGVTIMPNEDMVPRLDAGDLLLYYRLERSPQIQDIAVIRRADSGRQYVLRVIARPGDTVEITDERGLSVNGNTLSEPYIYYPTKPYMDQIEFPIVLGEGEYFVLADYRNGGEDSRYFGPVTQDEIEGIVITVLRRNNL